MLGDRIALRTLWESRAARRATAKVVDELLAVRPHCELQLLVTHDQLDALNVAFGQREADLHGALPRDRREGAQQRLDVVGDDGDARELVVQEIV